jgi:CDP-paratose 2-epimerase
MSVALITGSGGLVGSEAAAFLAAQGLDVVGIDNDMRATLFGCEGSTAWRVSQLQQTLPAYRHHALDIRDFAALEELLADVGKDLQVVIHAAAQPSHDWAARDPFTDFAINANGTLNLLEATRRHAADAAFVYLSTNKVYGDRPNGLPLIELETRWEVDPAYGRHSRGIDESMSVDQTTHSLFGASKLSADLMVQEYGRYFGMNTACFRAGCITGSGHSGTQLHGFLAYLVQCAVSDKPYTVFGYQGKQVRDNIHSSDLVGALWLFATNPRPARVYNIGGGRFANCSMIEAIASCEKMTGRPMKVTYSEQNRIGDHLWWISDMSAFRADYPDFAHAYDIDAMLADMHDRGRSRWLKCR